MANYQLETRCIHLEKESEDSFGALSFPIYQTATFAHPGLGESTGYDYTRLQNPTRERLEQVVAGLEQGRDAIAFASGMAAITAVMELFAPGDHLIVDTDLYGGSTRLFQNISEKNGITMTRVNCSIEDVSSFVKENTKAVYLETPTNPMMHVTDIKKLSRYTKERGLLLIVDNTFLSPYLQNPLLLGADIVLHSGTKYLGGHNDAIAGFVVTDSEELSERLRFIYKTTGAGLSPFDSWLLMRGIQTLALRMERAEENAGKIAQWLLTRPEVTRVIYPGLKDHPGYEIMKKQSRGFGAMLTFDVESRELAQALLERVHLIRFAESLGGTETLLTYPITQTHADVPKEELAANDVRETTLRLSVGIENCGDLIRDLEQAFWKG
jgi:cystathionine gamma-synthase